MPNPYPIELRERAVRAYEDSTETYIDVAARFGIAVSTLCLWVHQARDTAM
jgi:transposase-like protein